MPGNGPNSCPSASLYISVISVMELEIGILLIERRDKEQGAILRAWTDRRVLPTFSGRILAINTAVAQRCAALHVPDPRSDRDALIAATAFVHGLTVATRNVVDFEPMGVDVVILGNLERGFMSVAGIRRQSSHGVLASSFRRRAAELDGAGCDRPRSAPWC
jgi:toxin FitB